MSGLPSAFPLDPIGWIIADAVGEREWDDPVVLEQMNAYLPKESSRA
ncbi:MAG: hypothetical protein AB2602_10535 [Candidatus Thiodiazotropha sp.]